MHEPYPPTTPGGPTVVVGYEKAPDQLSNMVASMRKRDPNPLSSDGYPRLEIFDDRVRLIEGPIQGKEWFRSDGDRVLYVRAERSAGVYVGSNAGSAIDARYFDVARLRTAFLAHGWSWEADGTVTEPVVRRLAAQYAPAQPQTELVLKPHKEVFDVARLMRLASRVWMALGAAVLAVGIMVTAILLGSVAFFITLGVVVVLPLAVLCVQAVRHTGRAVTISRDRVVVRTGSNTQTVERARMTGPATVDKYGVKFKVGKSFRDEVYISTSRRREELLAQLYAYGWQVEEK